MVFVYDTLLRHALAQGADSTPSMHGTRLHNAWPVANRAGHTPATVCHTKISDHRSQQSLEKWQLRQCILASHRQFPPITFRHESSCCIYARPAHPGPALNKVHVLPGSHLDSCGWLQLVGCLQGLEVKASVLVLNYVA